MQISFERQILEGLGNTDMLSAYVRAAVADRGDGVKVNGALWPHLTPPAKVGGVARALVKMGLLAPIGAGVYQVVTSKEDIERNGSDDQATDQRRAGDEPAFAAEPLQDMGLDASEGQAEPERDIDAFIDISDIDETQPAAPVIGMGLRRPPVAFSTAPAPVADNEASVEAKARAMALEAWALVDARTFETCEGDFDQFWTYRKRHFLAQARQELELAGS